MKSKFLSFILSISIAFASGPLTGCVFAEEIPFKVTPAQVITTSKKSALNEGDTIKFKVTEPAGYLKKGDIITGVVTSIEQNGFAGAEAKVLIEDFKFENKNIGGFISLLGNQHGGLKEFANLLFYMFTKYVRGGEVIVNPEECDYILYLEN